MILHGRRVVFTLIKRKEQPISIFHLLVPHRHRDTCTHVPPHEF
jgi:hypothetical protein